MKTTKMQSQKKSGKAKRWFVGASGWGLTLAAGSGLASVNSSKSKRDLPMVSGDKVYAYTGNINGAGLLCNTIYTGQVTTGIAQGTTESTRIGSSIQLKNCILNYKYSNTAATTVNKTRFLRVLLVANQSESSATGFTSGLGSSDLFYTTTDLTITRVNPRLSKVFCDQLIVIQPCIDGTTNNNTTTAYGTVECNLDVPFDYRTGTNYGINANLYWIVVAQADNDSNGTSQEGSFTWESVVTFTDKH